MFPESVEYRWWCEPRVLDLDGSRVQVDVARGNSMDGDR